MKKFLVLLLATVVLASSFVFPSFADEPDNIGGLDFYSITFHYSEPVVIEYKYNRRKDTYVFAEPVTEYSIYATESRSNQIISKDEVQLSKDEVMAQYKAVKFKSADVDSSKLEYSEYPTKGAYITHIGDNTALRLDLVNPYGLTSVDDLYDDDKTPNPNVVFDGGYVISNTVNEDGTNDRLDVNGFIIDENELWHDATGRRIEPYKDNGDGTYTWLSVAERKDASGCIAKLSDPANTQFDGVFLYRVDPDKNGDGYVSQSEYDEYCDPDKVFTQDDIMVVKTPAGELPFQGSPVSGTPKTKAKITAITIELDALGTQLYADVTSDPQQQNTITLTSGNLLENIEAADKLVESNPDKVNSIGKLLGVAKSVTTKDKMNLVEKAELTYKSVKFDISEDLLNSLEQNLTLYLRFDINTLQPTTGFNISDTYYSDNEDSYEGEQADKFKPISVTVRDVKVQNLMDKDSDGAIVVTPDDEIGKSKINIFGLELEPIVLIIAIVAVVVVLAIIIILLIVLSKKKKKKAAIAESAEEISTVEDVSEDAESETADVAETEAESEVAEEAAEAEEETTDDTEV